MDNTELAGRIEAVTKCVLHLIADLEDRQLLDGPRFAQNLRGCIQPAAAAPPYLALARDRLTALADVLDQARQARLAR